MKKHFILFMALFISVLGFSQDKKDDGLFNESNLQSFKWRNVGPAFTSGRIADIAVHPTKPNTWYVATASSGVWKTENAGTTWKSIFEGQKVFSMGCITIDPHNHNRIWLGTGENVGGRHIAWGDGVYLSEDGGSSWKNMGLKTSEHVSEIIVHPTNPNIVWVASQGPLWSKGGERGFYISEDGGKTWKRTLGDDQWTGVTDIAVDPRDPNVLYAATWERHRTVAAYMGGGKNTRIYKSMDGGLNWTKLTNGLPSGNMGKIGLAISPQKPDVIYAAIELDRRKGGVYKSTNGGASWSKQSSTVSGGTGPHYYQELYASPHYFDEIYLMDVRVQVSKDGGKSFSRLQEKKKHSDNHAIVFKKDDPDYLMIGTDAGIYETFDGAKNWKFIDNLPLTQYYKVAVDDQEPFYYIYGGTQDNGSHSGPSRTVEREGIRNAHWYKTLFADGHQSATEPGNPDIFYAETQRGGIYRIDRITGEQVSVQPQPGEGEETERFNWDAPIVVSPHNPKRLYFASHRVWKSEDRGDSWEAISGDLTTDQERIKLPIMGSEKGWDNPWDIYAMSMYSTITSLSESPIEEGLIYAGTDDGVIQSTSDGGANWSKTMIKNIAGVPALAFVNDIRADLHDANIVYACLDNHKQGDYKPYLIKSTNRGKTWRLVANGIGEQTLVWRVVQDHVEPNLLFAATERGVYVSFDRAENWMKFSGGLPTISIRDITIQRRENDLVAASFGRGFFVLDDYSALRSMSKESLKTKSALYPIKDALQFKRRSIVGSPGAGMYTAKNPAYGATFTYHINDDYKSKKSIRKKSEGKKKKDGGIVSFPGWDTLMEEKNEESPKLWFIIKDADGNMVKRIEKPYRNGIQQTTWDLSYESQGGIPVDGKEGSSWWGGMPALPGTYSVTMMKYHNGELTELAGPESFKVKTLMQGALPGVDATVVKEYRAKLSKMRGAMSACRHELSYLQNKVKAMNTAAKRTNGNMSETFVQLKALKDTLSKMQLQISGDPNKSQVGAQQQFPSINSRYWNALDGAYSQYGPTATHQKSFDIAKNLFNDLRSKLVNVKDEVNSVEQSLIKAGAPYIYGQPIPTLD